MRLLIKLGFQIPKDKKLVEDFKHNSMSSIVL